SNDILVVPTISPDGTQFAYEDSSSGTLYLYIGNIIYENGTPPVVNGTTLVNAFPTGSGGLRPMIANNGAVVVRDGSTTTSPIMLYQVGHTPVTIAGSADFSALGNNPGIDATGNIVAFYGDLTSAGAADLNATNQNNITQSTLQVQVDQLTAGPGIFVSIPLGSSGSSFGAYRLIVRLAGISGNGFLDPGETWIGGTDVGPFSAFPDDRVMPVSTNRSRSPVLLRISTPLAGERALSEVAKTATLAAHHSHSVDCKAERVRPGKCGNDTPIVSSA